MRTCAAKSVNGDLIEAVKAVIENPESNTSISDLPPLDGARLEDQSGASGDAGASNGN